MSGNTPRITAAERRENERIRAQRKSGREEWAAYVLDELGKKLYLANPTHTDREFTEIRGSSKRFPTEGEANEAAYDATTIRRLRPPVEGSTPEARFWETVRRNWITDVGVERIK